MMKNHPRFGRAYKYYRFISTAVAVIGVAYVVLLAFPEALFAYSKHHGEFLVHSREPIDDSLVRVLDTAEAKLKTSPIYDGDTRRDIFLTSDFRMYTFLSHTAYKSFANSVPLIDNVFVSKTDIPNDRVFVNRELNNSRSLSGVIAHEIVHLFIRKRYGTISATLMPTWKVEGYCDYVAGESTIPLEEGIRRWRENPSDDPSYRYVKYHLMVRHLLENEKVAVDDLFNGSFDETEVAQRVFASLPQ